MRMVTLDNDGNANDSQSTTNPINNPTSESSVTMCNEVSQPEHPKPVYKPQKQRGIIYFRRVQSNDREVIQRLHEHWFPVDYKSDFFDGLCDERVMPGMSEPLYSCVACFKELNDDEFEEFRERQSGCIKDGGLLFLFGRRRHAMSNDYVYVEEYGECILWESDNLPDDNRDDKGRVNSEKEHQDEQNLQLLRSRSDSSACSHSSEKIEREKIVSFYNKLNSGISSVSSPDGSSHGIFLNSAGERIVGCLVGSYLSSSRLSTKHESEERDETAALLVPEPERYPRMFYIMTLGTVADFRRIGLGSILVNRVVDMIQTRPECGALYLHVITYNKGAMKLYERLSFAKVKEIQDYYTINNVNYNCYLYARYFHGNRGHRQSIYNLIYEVASSLLQLER